MLSLSCVGPDARALGVTPPLMMPPLPAWAANVALTGRVAAATVTALFVLQLVAPGVRPVFALVPAR